MFASATLLLVLAAGAGPTTEVPVPNERTPPESWSSDGWNGFRWRMGPGDVQSALKTAGNPLFGGKVESSADKYELKVSVRSSGLSIAGEAVDAHFSFFLGRLYSVYLAPRDSGVGWLWRRRVRALLSEKYGTPTEAEGACHWFFSAPRELSVALLPHSAIIYVDVAALSRLNEVRSRDNETAQREKAQAEHRKEVEARERRLREHPDLKNM